ncbi:hemolysin-type calcium-binding domain-containing protein (plasmid) [Rhizobium sp. NXC14]|uniref:calcium-binding protein n=1 Tax=Rhizobium sp. NXC14 TaxID=1981173 RepID=UPI000A207436|nr:calcium-binding protein [Rhizobium sp. NXC14]ARO33654.1 hemolysin-type calcium-binding domain-containing protein [Rhizobium sp. NXC14]
MAETRTWDQLADVFDYLGAVAAGAAQYFPQYPALKYVGPMLIDGLGQIAGAATPDDPTAGLPEQLRDSAAKFLGGVVGAALAPAIADMAGLALFFGGGITAGPLLSAILLAGATYIAGKYMGEAFAGIGDLLFDPDSPLVNLLRDPLVLDLDGDGIELTALAGSATHFDYGQDGFAERTGWVSADDGILVRDVNRNGTVDGAGELFGSPTQDGFAVLETMDSNGDGRIDIADAGFQDLYVWQDSNQNGQADAGELKHLSDLGINSVSVIRQAVGSTNQGNVVGYEGTFTQADGTTGASQTIYFQTDDRDTVGDNTPDFVAPQDVKQLPQLPGSGQLNSIAWVATNDPEFKSDWLALTDAAAGLSFDDLKSQFQQLLLRWAGVDDIDSTSRGQFVDARHLVFIEKFFGSEYQEIRSGNQTTTSPSTEQFGDRIESSFDSITDLLLSNFLAQTDMSKFIRTGDINALVSSPYFALGVLTLNGSEDAPDLKELVEQASTLLLGARLGEMGATAELLVKGFLGLDGMAASAFDGDRVAYLAALRPQLDLVADSTLSAIVTSIADGSVLEGSVEANALIGSSEDNVFIAGKGNDVTVGGAGSDLYIYSAGDGSDYIRDSSASLVENDRLFLTDQRSSDLTFERTGNSLRIGFVGKSETIISEDFFLEWGKENRGVDSIILGDGAILSREDIRARTTTTSAGSSQINDSALDDIIHGTSNHEEIRISGGNDTILYSEGDGFDIITDTSGNAAEKDVLNLGQLKPSDIELSRVDDALFVKILASGEYITDRYFFRNETTISTTGGWGIDQIRFADGVIWNRDAIKASSVVRGDDAANALAAYSTSDRYQGGKGNDSISGGAGSDTYIWRKGDGSDTIIDNSSDSVGFDKLVLSDVGPGDIELSRAGTSLKITILSTREVIEITDQFSGIDNIVDGWNSTKLGIEAIEFGNGAQWSRDTIMKGIVNVGLDTEIFFAQDPLSGGVIVSYFEDELGHRGDVIDISSPYFNGMKYSGIHDIKYGSESDDSIGGANVNPVDSTVASTEGANYFDGRGGNDVLTGGAGHDALIGGDGADTLYGDTAGFESSLDGNDQLDGGKGNDALYGAGGNDYLSGGDGIDQLYGGTGDDYLFDSSSSGGEAGVPDDYFDGGKGDDTIVSAQTFSAANGGASNGNDIFVYRRGDGNDVIFEGSHSMTEVDKLLLLDIGAQDVELTQRGIDLVLTIGSTHQTITEAGFFWNYGSASQGMEQIIFDDGEIWNREYVRQHLVFRGSDARETIQNNDGYGNTFISQKGDDIIISASIRGGANGGAANGNDKFIYSRGDGNDLFFDGSHSQSETDTLVLTDIRSSEVIAFRSGIDFVLKDLVTGQLLINEGFFWNWDSAGQGIDVVQFADGVSWNRTQMRDNAWYRGSVTNDLLQTAEKIDNIFFGDLGDDIIVSAAVRGGANGGGATGNDLFIYNLGDGNDLIFDGSFSLSEIDRLELRGINVHDVMLGQSGSDLIIKITSSGQQIVDEGAFWNRSTVGQGLEEIKFADGTIWNREDIRYWAQEGSIFYGGTSANETLIGSYFDQNLSGNSGNDFIDGKGGSDIIHGDVGNDTLALSVANVGEVDQLDGGAGTDTVTFEQFQSSVYVDMVANNGEARTGDTTSASTATDRLIATLVNNENLKGTAFSDVLLADAGNNTLEGGAGDDVMDGRSGDDQLDGGVGADTLRGGLGNDTYVYRAGDGADVIFETLSQGTADTLKLSGITPSAVSLVREGNDLKIQFSGSSGDQITLVNGAATPVEFDQYGIEKIQFDDGTIWDAAVLRQKSVYAGATAGNDTLTGTTASGDFGGGKGDDVLNAGGGNDNYIYRRGDGFDRITEDANSGVSDRITLVDITKEEVLLHRVANDLYIEIKESHAGAADSGLILVKGTLGSTSQQGVEQISFADGTIWSATQILAAISNAGWLPPATITGTSADDVLTGTTNNDIFDAGGGDDRLEGKEGTDVYIYRAGSGSDIITDYRGSRDNKLMLGPGIETSDVVFARVAGDSNDMKLAFRSMAGSVTFDNQLWGDAGVEFIEFADGTVWDETEISRRYVADQQTSGDDTIWGTNLSDAANGGAGNDTLMTYSGNDRLAGGAGNDRLEGAEGSDVYVYNSGDGDDVIFDYRGSRDNVLEFGAGIAATDVVFSRVASDSNDIKLAFSTISGSVVLDGQLWGDAGIEFIRFADGTVWNETEMLRRYVADQQTSGNDIIWGTNLADLATGGAGNDTIVTYGGNDRLVGGTGNDRLEGSGGTDVYVYNVGDGDDAIFDYTGSRDNVLEFGAGISAADVVFSRVASDAADMMLMFRSMAGSIVLDNQHWGDAGVEFIRFADGTVWDDAEIARRYVAGQTTDGDDTIWATNLSDNVVGGAGNDTIAGYDGNDRLAGGAGNDRLDGGGGNDVYVYNIGDGDDAIFDYQGSRNNVLEFGAGISAADVVFSRVASDAADMKLTFQSMAGSIVLDNQHWGDAGVEFIRFADGTVWDDAEIARRYVAGQTTDGDDTIWATNLSDNVLGGAGNDTIAGYDGNDRLVGGTGNDRLDGGGGNDVYVYNVGDGDDAIFDYQSSRNNGLEFGAGIAVTDVVFSRVTSDVNDMKLSFRGLTGSIVVDNQLWSDAGVDFVRFADGTVWNKTQIAAHYVADQETAGDDIIWGNYGADTIQGGAGNDTLRGVGGNDVFVFKAGFGKDAVTDFSAGSGIGDILDISNDLFADFASVLAAATQVGADTVITHDANTSITLKNVALTSLHQDDFRFTAAA